MTVKSLVNLSYLSDLVKKNITSNRPTLQYDIRFSILGFY